MPPTTAWPSPPKRPPDRDPVEIRSLPLCLRVEMFWFTLDSPYYGHSFWQIAFGPRIDPDRANLAGAAQDFWFNPLWRHKDVAWAMGETVLMRLSRHCHRRACRSPSRVSSPPATSRPSDRSALPSAACSTSCAASMGSSGPSSSPAPSAPAPYRHARHRHHRHRGFGKSFSEALENVDDKQIEGVRSNRRQRDPALSLWRDPAGHPHPSQPGALLLRIQQSAAPPSSAPSPSAASAFSSPRPSRRKRTGKR